VAGWEADGHVVAGVATAAVAAQNLQTESGITSKTVAQWVLSIRTAQTVRTCIANGHTAGDGGAVIGDAERRTVEDAARHGGLGGVDVLVLDEANLTDDRDRAVPLHRSAADGDETHRGR
jgi:AAA domain